MKKFLFLTFLVSLMVFPAMAQDNDVSPNIANNDVTIQGSGGSRALGDTLFVMDVEGPTALTGCLGMEFDGTYFWVTARDTVNGHQFFLFNQDGTIQTQYNQNSGGSWGVRDLAWDGTYMYGGDDVAFASKIAIFDPANGSTLGTYGPFGVNPCRALAYHEPTDSFFTGSFGSSIYQCFRDGTETVYGDSLTAKYGAAYCAATGMIWWWDQIGPTAHEWDPNTGTYTGVTFLGAGGSAGGACIYVNDNVDDGVNTNVDGIWKFAGLHQSTPDVITSYSLDLKQDPLVSLPTSIDDPGPASAGALIQFDLYAGPQNANRAYGIFGGITGVNPGTLLPGGLVLPVNWDTITNVLINNLAWGIGGLNGDGEAQHTLWIPPNLSLPGTVPLYFAYCLPFPYDFVSNAVQVNLEP